uniref:Uncharacterized protein n=1 Tax=Megaselia scalaris TaxID=36166 RepID=T1GP76_MEGSC
MLVPEWRRSIGATCGRLLWQMVPSSQC